MQPNQLQCQTHYPESSSLVGAAQSVWNGSDALITIQLAAPPRIKEIMQSFNLDEIETIFITDSDIRHIKTRHSQAEETRGQLEILPEDFAHIPEILERFENVTISEKDKLGNKRFLIRKRIGNIYYVITVQRGNRKLEIKTMWKKPGASC